MTQVGMGKSNIVNNLITSQMIGRVKRNTPNLVIMNLETHQSDVIEKLLKEKKLLVITGTRTGKTHMMNQLSKSTCDGCIDKLICQYSGDTYNTNGDCLANK